VEDTVAALTTKICPLGSFETLILPVLEEFSPATYTLPLDKVYVAPPTVSVPVLGIGVAFAVELTICDPLREIL
jgi:hypothetical protein